MKMKKLLFILLIVPLLFVGCCQPESPKNKLYLPATEKVYYYDVNPEGYLAYSTTYTYDDDLLGYTLTRNCYDEEGNGEQFTMKVLLAESIATAIDALSVGFTIAEYNFGMALLEFAAEFNIREISNFAETTNIALNSFGNIADILQETSSVISRRIELDFEIKKMFYEKKFELKLLIVIPIMIYAFLSMTANEYLAPMYASLPGYLVLTVTLLLILAAYILGNKMMGVKLDD